MKTTYIRSAALTIVLILAAVALTYSLRLRVFHDSEKQLTHVLSEHARRMAERLDTAEHRLRELSGQLGACSNRVMALEAAYAEEQATTEPLRAQVKAMLAERVDTRHRIAAQSNELARLVVERTELEARRRDTAMEADALRAELEETKAALSGARAGKADAADRYAAAEARITAQSNQLVRLQAELAAAHRESEAGANRIAALEQRVAEADANQAARATELSALKQQLAEAQAAVTALESQRNTLQTQLRQQH